MIIPVRLHLAQAVGQHLLTDAFEIFTKFVESPRARTQIADNEQLPLAPDQLYRGSYGAHGQFFFCRLSYTHFVLHLILHVTCLLHHNTQVFSTRSSKITFLLPRHKKVRTLQAPKVDVYFLASRGTDPPQAKIPKTTEEHTMDKNTCKKVSLTKGEVSVCDFGEVIPISLSNAARIGSGCQRIHSLFQ